MKVQRRLLTGDFKLNTLRLGEVNGETSRWRDLYNTAGYAALVIQVNSDVAYLVQLHGTGEARVFLRGSLV